MDNINICVCTYKRKALLNKCLQSLYDMAIPADTIVTLTIIDNDDQQSAKQVIDALSPAGSLPTYYVNELSRGIPHARNRALAESQALQADYLVFIDDDEWVAHDWLCTLYGYCIQRGGEIVVSGEVIAELPDNVPDAIAPLLVSNKQRPTGTALSACATNNVIFPLSFATLHSLQFDASNPQAGGEDTIFFTKMAKLGIVIERCAEAIVYEHIPATRATLKWLAKRKFWAGSINAWRKRQHGRLWISIFVSSLLQVFGYGLIALVFTLVGQSLRRNKAILKASRSAGEISGLFGYRMDSY